MCYLLIQNIEFQISTSKLATENILIGENKFAKSSFHQEESPQQPQSNFKA